MEGVRLTGVEGVVSVRAETGVLWRLEERRSRAAALPVPFFDAGGMVVVCVLSTGHSSG